MCQPCSFDHSRTRIVIRENFCSPGRARTYDILLTVTPQVSLWPGLSHSPLREIGYIVSTRLSDLRRNLARDSPTLLTQSGGVPRISPIFQKALLLIAALVDREALYRLSYRGSVIHLLTSQLYHPTLEIRVGYSDDLLLYFP